MNKEELAQQYADQKVLEKNEYPLYNLHKRKELTRFDGFEIEQAFEDGFIKAISSSACLKDAQGDDLPEIDREVIALVSSNQQGYIVVFAHRPNPKGWDGKSLTTGKVEHYTPKTYDQGGWNQPNVKYWIDVTIPGTK